MEGELATVLVRSTVGAVIAGLGFAIRSLFVRMRTAEARVKVLEETRPAPDTAGREALAELQQFKLCVAENYIRRDDYIPQVTTLITRVDAIGVMVARVDERFRIGRGIGNES